jgi:hypothetical protein
MNFEKSKKKFLPPLVQQPSNDIILICLPTIFITDNSLSKFSISSGVASSD